jgi:hypothetical protein
VCFRVLDFGGEHGRSALPVRDELPEKMGFSIRWCLVGAEVLGERRRLLHGGGRKQLEGALAWKALPINGYNLILSYRQAILLSPCHCPTQKSKQRV